MEHATWVKRTLGLLMFVLLMGCQPTDRARVDDSNGSLTTEQREAHQTALAGAPPWTAGITTYREGASGKIAVRSFSTQGELTDRLSNLRVWRQGRRVVGLQAEYESSGGRKWGPVVGKQVGHRVQFDWPADLTVVEVDAPHYVENIKTIGLITLRVKAIPITRSGERKVTGPARYFHAGDWQQPVELDAPWFRSGNFYEHDGGYPLSEVIGFWGNLDENGSICSIGVVRQQSPKHNVGYSPFQAKMGEAGAVGEDPVEPRGGTTNGIGTSISRIQSWVDSSTRRIVGLRLDWYDNGVAPMRIGKTSGAPYKQWELAYEAGLVRVNADFDNAGYLTKLDLLVSAMSKAGSGPPGGASHGSTQFGIGSSTRKQGEVKSVDFASGPYGGPCFYDLVLKGEPDNACIGIRGFDIVTRMSEQYVTRP